MVHRTPIETELRNLRKRTAAAFAWDGHCVYAEDNESINAVREAVHAKAQETERIETAARLTAEVERLKAERDDAREALKLISAPHTKPAHGWSADCGACNARNIAADAIRKLEDGSHA